MPVMVTSNKNYSNSCHILTRTWHASSYWHQHNELRLQAPAWVQFGLQQHNLVGQNVSILCGLNTHMALAVTRRLKTSLHQRKVSANRSSIDGVSFGMLFLLLLMQVMERRRPLTKYGTTMEDPQVSPLFLTVCWKTGKDTGAMVESILCSTLEEDSQLQLLEDK